MGPYINKDMINWNFLSIIKCIIWIILRQKYAALHRLFVVLVIYVESMYQYVVDVWLAGVYFQNNCKIFYANRKYTPHLNDSCINTGHIFIIDKYLGLMYIGNR